MSRIKTEQEFAKWNDQRIIRYQKSPLINGDSGAPIYKIDSGDKILYGVHVFSNAVRNFRAGTLITKSKQMWINTTIKEWMELSSAKLGIKHSISKSDIPTNEDNKDKEEEKKEEAARMKRKRTAKAAGIDVFNNERRKRFKLSPPNAKIT